jgi:hypothetical protein
MKDQIENLQVFHYVVYDNYHVIKIQYSRFIKFSKNNLQKKK